MSRVDVLMPQMGESIAEGTLSKWLKKLGDAVKRDDPLCAISTDKVDAEIPAPSAGTLVEIRVQEGQTVPVQTLVAVIETEKWAVASAAGAPPPSPAAQRAPAGSGGTAPAAPPAPQRVPAAPGGAVAAAQSAPTARPADRPTAPAGKGDGGVQTVEERLRTEPAPLVRRI